MASGDQVCSRCGMMVCGPHNCSPHVYAEYLQTGEALCHCTHPDRHCEGCLRFCPDYNASDEALKEYLIADKAHDELFVEMVEFVKFAEDGDCIDEIDEERWYSGDCGDCISCKAKALLAKIKVAEKGGGDELEAI